MLGINSMAESSLPHMKTEIRYQQHFDHHLAARTAVMEYIESWHNRRRPHAAGAAKVGDAGTRGDARARQDGDPGAGHVASVRRDGAGTEG